MVTLERAREQSKKTVCVLLFPYTYVLLTKASTSYTKLLYNKTSFSDFQLAIMWASKNKSVDLTHFESKSSGIDSGDEIISSERSSHTSGDTKDTG